VHHVVTINLVSGNHYLNLPCAFPLAQPRWWSVSRIRSEKNQGIIQNECG
jgi:hypothetical protein